MKDEKCRGVLLQDGQTDRQTNKQTFVIAFETENFILLFFILFSNDISNLAFAILEFFASKNCIRLI